MRIIVCPHDMGMGGSQLSALDLAAAIQRRGHRVMVYAAPGRLAYHARHLGLELTVADPGTRLSASWAAGLMRLVRSWRPDVVHTYEWAPAMGASLGAHGLFGTAQVMTVRSREVPRFLPRHLDLVVGNRRLWATTDTHPHRHLMEPPIDTVANAPGDRVRARTAFGIAPESSVITMAGRMTDDLDKAAGVLAAIDAVDRLAEYAPVVLLAAGDGPALGRVRQVAERVNARHRRRVVQVPGHLMDVGLAYDASDIVVGMGSSVLRGMAFARPAIVLGAAGFCAPVTEQTLDSFGWQGYYGVGDGRDHWLLPHLEHLIADPVDRLRRGVWSRSVVEEHYSLRRAALLLDNIYRNALERRQGPRVRAASLARSAAGLGAAMATRFLANRQAPAARPVSTAQLEPRSTG